MEVAVARATMIVRHGDPLPSPTARHFGTLIPRWTNLPRVAIQSTFRPVEPAFEFDGLPAGGRNMRRIDARPCSFACALALVLAIHGLGHRATWADHTSPGKATQQTEPTEEKSPKDSAKHANQHVMRHLLQSTAYLEGEPEDGPGLSGTGWVLDAEKRLIVTNKHVANPDDRGELKSLFAWFPARVDNELVHDVDYYVQNIPKIPVKIIATDDVRDLALVQADSLPDGIAALRLAAESPEAGDRLHSLAGFPRGSQGLFIYTQGTARAIYKRGIANGKSIQVLETQMPLNQGNSGGPILNDEADVVAVFEGLMIDPGVQLVNMSIDLKEVRAFLEEALPLVTPESAEDWNRRGDLHFENQRYNSAFADYTQAMERFPDDATARSNRGWVYQRRGDPITALAEFNDALKLDPKLMFAHWGLGLVYRDQQKYDESIEELTTAIRESTEDGQVAQLLNERGNTYFAQGQYDAALADFDRAIDKKGDDAWTHANRGETLAKLGRLEDAFASLDKALGLQPGTPQFWNLAGNIWFEQSRYDLAINMYSKAIEVGGSDAVYYRNRGGAHRRAGHAADAAVDLEKAIELAPGNDDYWNELGGAYHDAGRYDLAVAAFTQAIQRNAKNATYLQNRGEANDHQGEHAQVVADLTAAIELEDTADRRALRGNAYRGLGNESAAQADYARATSLDSDYKIYDRRYLKIVNDSNRQIEVRLVYHTYTTEKRWRWYPADPGKGESVSYTFEPGESGVLYHDDWKVNAAKVRLWATGGDLAWPDYQNKDLVISPPGGYLSKEGDFEVYTYNFYVSP